MKKIVFILIPVAIILITLFVKIHNKDYTSMLSLKPYIRVINESVYVDGTYYAETDSINNLGQFLSKGFDISPSDLRLYKKKEESQEKHRDRICEKLPFSSFYPKISSRNRKHEIAIEFDTLTTFLGINKILASLENSPINVYHLIYPKSFKNDNRFLSTYNYESIETSVINKRYVRIIHGYKTDEQINIYISKNRTLLASEYFKSKSSFTVDTVRNNQFVHNKKEIRKVAHNIGGVILDKNFQLLKKENCNIGDSIISLSLFMNHKNRVRYLDSLDIYKKKYKYFKKDFFKKKRQILNCSYIDYNDIIEDNHNIIDTPIDRHKMLLILLKQLKNRYERFYTFDNSVTIHLTADISYKDILKTVEIVKLLGFEKVGIMLITNNSYFHFINDATKDSIQERRLYLWTKEILPDPFNKNCFGKAIKLHAHNRQVYNDTIPRVNSLKGVNVSLGATISITKNGGRYKKLIREIFEYNLDGLINDYAIYLKRAEKSEGSIRLKIIISKDGSVSNVELEKSDFQDKAFIYYLKKRLSLIDFGEVFIGETVLYQNFEFALSN